MTANRVFSLPQHRESGGYPLVLHVFWHDVAQVHVSSTELRIWVAGYANSGYATVQFSKGGLFGRPGVDPDAFAAFADRLQRRVAASKSGGPAAKTEATDFLSQLERLAILREKGHLSKEEFEAAKHKLLNA